MFYASFFFFLSSKSIPRKVSSKILIQDFIRLNELMSFGMIYYAWSRDDKYPQVPQDLSAHLAGYLGFACRSGSTSTFIYSFFFFFFFFSSIRSNVRLTWRGFERIVLDIPILDPTIRRSEIIVARKPFSFRAVFWLNYSNQRNGLPAPSLN